MRATLRGLFQGGFVVALAACATPTQPPVVDPGTLLWTQQFGTSNSDASHAIASDPNANVYLAGSTSGVLGGANAGSTDAFVRSHDSAGALRWTRQFGTGSADQARSIAVHADGNVYAAGDTLGALDGVNAGSIDSFVRSYDSGGNLRWTRQFGTSVFDLTYGITTDPNGDVYVTGSTGGDLEGTNAGALDAFVRAYNSAGTLRWTRQFGTNAFDEGRAIDADAAGNIYVVGHTGGALGAPSAGGMDAFIRSYDRDGNLRWTRQFGTGSLEYAYGIASDASANVYLTGNTSGALEGVNAGGFDGYVRSYDANGALRWTRQFGSPETEEAYAVATDTSGNVYSTGYTSGVIEGENAGAADAFVRVYDSMGTLRWTRQFGTSSGEHSRGIATDDAGNAYVTGYTAGSLVGTSAGGDDVFIRKYSP